MSIDGEVRLHHPSFEDDVEEGAIQMSQSVWTGDKKSTAGPRIACQAILNSNDDRRLHWAVIPEGCVLSNSVCLLYTSPSPRDY